GQQAADLTLAARTEYRPLAVGVLDRVREVHDAVRVRAMVEAGHVPELVDRLDEGAAAELILVVGQAVEAGPEPGEADDPAASAHGRLSEDEGEARHEQVGVGDAQRPAGARGAGAHEGIERVIAAVLSAPRVVPRLPERERIGELDLRAEDFGHRLAE